MTFEGTWSHRGGLKSGTVSRNLKRAGFLWGYIATCGGSEGWGLQAKIRVLGSSGSQD